ncbi:Hypothetical_protein [Hexamita inflata]|uniref:Hypothetical_protein n=1 Tax=Hexamita inflata TaxID=28002 RepID=A0ABP1HQP6_9EUKA
MWSTRLVAQVRTRSIGTVLKSKILSPFESRNSTKSWIFRFTGSVESINVLVSAFETSNWTAGIWMNWMKSVDSLYQYTREPLVVSTLAWTQALFYFMNYAKEYLGSLVGTSRQGMNCLKPVLYTRPFSLIVALVFPFMLVWHLRALSLKVYWATAVIEAVTVYTKQSKLNLIFVVESFMSASTIF